jgi:hypothetical protein
VEMLLGKKNQLNSTGFLEHGSPTIRKTEFSILITATDVTPLEKTWNNLIYSPKLKL